ncbi:hypothetical protein ASC75_19705 [Aminobacter sp. DSM 101952]|jgi:hypothetical protein|uniref:Uncharacterized protein n=4 Tax=Alphaproteobacteria TaxID=28211 RepID=A0A512HMS8_9HYPH|nr:MULTISPECIES: hypothetical protein [Alphaproteobacteria]KRA66693.1 hypothetical protein ASD85_24555 [Rhizobium sp. Root651]KQU75093.1 hypothetical protein ASC75_19705 [Aminobacter sp. DSM 101952]MBE0562617.1 hypothetical protein [Brucella anthropi]MDH2091811.1 hypothetical protein [Agrobacterium pusense]GEO86700.1 hypothetical protein RNA01_36320 [Ciceribacter naphthalenivorans]
MAKIERLSTRHVSSDRSLERIVAAARAEPGLWLMIKEREMELRTMRAELERLGAKEGDIDHLFPQRLKPTLSELADDLVSRMFGGCPPDMLAPVQDTLLAAARHDLDASPG